MSERSEYRFVEEHYNIEELNKKLVKIYEKLLLN